eukprot:TRINITY_DN12617_c1_g3_i4.p1 TRINITY_DN12617_c1_g3~~TRINITY_DN12617_c1_g3_i4.p1  ORF type:complete len:386 (+),score=40.19 TRINITY_DN12617_c1_g3_i4:125-1282(+)
MAARLTQEHLDLVNAQETAALHESPVKDAHLSDRANGTPEAKLTDDLAQVKIDVAVWCERIDILERTARPFLTFCRIFELILSWKHTAVSLTAFVLLQCVSLLPHTLPGITLLMSLTIFGFTFATRNHEPGAQLSKQLAQAADAYANLRKKPKADDIPVKLKQFSDSLLRIQSAMEALSSYCLRLSHLLLWRDPASTARFLGGLMLYLLAGCLVPFWIQRSYLITAASATKPVRARMLLLTWLSLPSADINGEDTDADHQRLTPMATLQEYEPGSDWVVLPPGADLDAYSVQSGSASEPVADSQASVSSKGARKRQNTKCSGCNASYSIFKSRVYCRNCGGSYCTTCCKFKVPRSVFGATAPAAQKGTVRVCNSCVAQLRAVDTQ